MNISFSAARVELFLNGFILRNICADWWVLSWAVGDVLNSVAREAQSSYHIWTALPVIFASLRRPSHVSPLCTAFLRSSRCVPAWFHRPDPLSGSVHHSSLFHVSVEGQLIWAGTVGNASLDCWWHMLSQRVCAETMGPSLYQGQKTNNSGSGQRQGGDVKCAALNVFTHGMLTGAE